MFGLSRARLPLLIVLAGAFALRAAAAVFIQHEVTKTPGRICLIDGDAAGYWDLGLKLAHGKEFSIYEPPRYVVRMPGFPLLLAAGMKLLGSNSLALRFLLAGVGTVACGLVYKLGADLFDASVGLIAAALAAVSPPMVVFSVLFLSETLFAAALLASLILLARIVRPHVNQSSSSRILAFAAGAACGFATLVRPTWLLIGPVFVALYVALHKEGHDKEARFFRKSRISACASLLLGLAITLLPWAIRNWRVTDHFVLTTLWAGPSLYDGLNPDATGASDMSFIEGDGLYAHMSEYDVDQHYRSAAWKFAMEHPGHAVALAFKKLGRFWNPFPNAEQFGQWYVQWGIALYFLPLLIFAIIGCWKTKRQFWLWFLPAAPILYFSAVHTVFVGSLRYRLPAEYPMLVLAAVGLSSLWSRVRSSPSRD